MSKFIAEYGAPLSKRELEVMRLAAEGKTAPEIGQELFITRNTVMAHYKKVRSKLGARSVTHAVAILIRKGEL